MVIVIVVVLVFLVIIVGVIRWYRRPPQLTRHLRSTSFSRRRSEAIKQAAADDVTTILDGDKYRGADTARSQDSEL